MDTALRKQCAAGLEFGAGFLAALLPTMSAKDRERLDSDVSLGAVVSVELVGEPTEVRLVLTSPDGERRVAWSARIDFGRAQ